MTSPALFVLFLALVCSIFGLASEQTADHDSKRTKMSKMAVPDYGPNVDSHWINKINRKYINYNENFDEVKPKKKFDEIYEENEIQKKNLDIHRSNVQKMKREMRNFDESDLEVKSRVKREENDPRCESFEFDANDKFITHPHPRNGGNNYYYNNSNCVTKITASSNNMVIELTFVDVFRIEYHPECAYDYLEIRDGYYGYADLLGRFCGQAFPRTLKTKGPHVWLKFHSDDTIEYDGFRINIEFKEGPSHLIPESCYKTFDGQKFGVIDTTKIDPTCTSYPNQALDVLWTIKAPENTKIYLNFTTYQLSKPNECNENIIQVFESVHQEMDSKLAEYCGSVANSVTTKDKNGNIMYVRLYVSKEAKNGTSFNATFNAYRTLDPAKDDKCLEDEFDCEDNTCIDLQLRCDHDAHCRLKADEDKATCDRKTESTINQPHLMVILIIFSLILSGMSFVFIFKCMRKLYQDHKIIKEHIRQSCEDRLDSLVGSRLTLDPKKLQRDSEPRQSLERDNHTNEMFKKQRSYSSKTKQPSIESDFIQETHLDLDEEPWRREVESMPIEEDVRIERNGRTRKSDLSRKEESMRSRTRVSEECREKREIRDVSVGAPDTKESGCQTRESLFQTDPPASSDGSGTNSRGFSTFGYSGATIIRPSPPAATNTSEITIELLKQMPTHEQKPPKKLPDRRPISTETTRSAPDVIIVSKPIR
ncbi:neuropilin and tolloid-like protein 2 [Trichoplusia ni]|uniref:Neuropilin and tolloid-like protein 2 n=1 Tax=Trichoplusia ni TaxID=7111 RepID=A0A7E5VJY9_TRINI|nr:neuropilin and tolloid-like protein 2 [Trichoplusia ni]